MTHQLYPNWKETIVFSPDGPQPQLLVENDKFKVILAGLEPGQKIPAHPEAQAMYHFLEGTGAMIVDGERLAVEAGTTVITPQGAVRGVEAEARLAFLAARVA